MHKKDYIEQLMAVYKQIEMGAEELGPGFEIRLREPSRTWPDLVDEATMHGLENMELYDLVKMAQYAKEILR